MGGADWAQLQTITAIVVALMTLLAVPLTRFVMDLRVRNAQLEARVDNLEKDRDEAKKRETDTSRHLSEMAHTQNQMLVTLGKIETSLSFLSPGAPNGS